MPGEIPPTGKSTGNSSGEPAGEPAGQLSGQPSDAPAGDGSPPPLRASHADRDRVVDVLRVAAGDGRLTAAELEERLETALSARTLGELAALTADLPPAAGTALAYEAGGAAAKEVVRIDQQYSAVERVGRWVVPRRMELTLEYCDVTLDFTEAVITQDTLRIDMEMEGKTLTLITRPDIVVDVDELRLQYSKVKHRRVPAAPGTPVTLRVELAGTKEYGRVVVRPPRRSFAQWLLRRPVGGGGGTGSLPRGS
ncbi:DUF1707 domain-containing protein [Streptomyces sp. ODS28]|uniref:DUF1707 SHOCT-like domain-containing protein n=1 Tax=Streptomyces sp. ODS28 TaxID=3136688 RepID=UPI0031F0E166